MYIKYGNSIRSKYDFSDSAVRFFYDSFETYYLTYSQTVDETKVNVFMSSNAERLRLYKQYKGFSTIKRYMELADDKDCNNYFETLKKYSLVREYGRNGYPVKNILSYKNFDKMSASDIYRIIRLKADRIHTVINVGAEAVDLTAKTSEQIDKYLDKPDYGLLFPWYMYNDYFLGLRQTKLIIEGFLSNEGKTRKLVMLAAYTALVQNESFLLISNEMNEDDLKNCLITTVINNMEFQKLHGVKLQKPEKEIVLGVYRDNKGEIIRRQIDKDGIYIESGEDFRKRVQQTSEEYWQVKTVTDWIDSEERKAKVYFKDVSNDYSPNAIELELRKNKILNNIKYYGYDTLKGWLTDDWSQIKQFVTKLKEITKELKMSGFAVFQLTDDSVFTDVFSLSSNNIANAKQVKHVVDMLTLGKRINKEEYHKYQMVCNNPYWGEPAPENLDLSKQYFGIKPDKNRSGEKDKVMLFEIDLNLNIWKNVGYLIKKDNNI